MIGMMDDMRFLTERRHEALLAEADARRLARGSTDEVEEDLSTNGHMPAKVVANTTVVGAAVAAEWTDTPARALRAVHTPSEATCGGSSPEACSEGQAAAA
jgi:hypothetical protein